MKTTIEYYKKAVKQAVNARERIEAAKAAYEHECELTKNAFDGGILGENGYKEQLEKLAQERDTKIEGALSRIDEVAAEYSTEMQELGRLDGSKIDDGTMKLLDSGLALSSADWQQLADQHRDNAVMSRILRQRYDADRPREEKPVAVRFGQSPENRSEVFGKFVRTIYHACKSGMRPSLSGRGRLKTTTDYYNFIAQDSLTDMQPFGGESFDNLDEIFPVETENGKVENVVGNSTSFTTADFNFNFTPVR